MASSAETTLPAIASPLTRRPCPRSRLEDLFRNTLSPGQWALVAAVPPAILALYFLKLRRTPLEVPSTYLWRKSIEDLRVNSLWQRLRRSLLLLLQLLAVTLAILALARPGWLGTELARGRLIFLVDNSASMSTADAGQTGDRPRIDVAKERVAGLIDQMERGMTAMIVSFAGEPRVVQQFTDNPRLLRERLATIQPTAGRTDLAGALELADGLANPAQLSVQEGAPEVNVVAAEPATLYVFSDGRFGDVEGFALGNLEPVYVPIGSPQTRNLAITAFETRRTEAQAGALSGFVQVANFGSEAVDAVVEVRRGERLVDARRLAIPAGEAAGASFPAGDASPSSGEDALTARVAEASLTAARDRLAVDDVAFAPLNDPRDGLTLLVTPGNVAIEQALQTGRAGRIGRLRVEPPARLQEDSHQRDAASGVFDLVIYDRCAPEEPPRAAAVYVGALPPGPAWRGAEGETAPPTVTVPQVIDWSRSHPLMASVELGNFDIVDSMVLTPPPGATTLVDAAEGPLVAVAPRGAFEELVIGFPVLVESGGVTQRNTDWINRHSFPTFWLNVLEHFVARSGGGSDTVRPGEAVELRPSAPAVREARIRTPSGREETIRRRGDDPFVWRQTDEVGLYRVFEGDRETRRFAVNLFDASESDVPLRVDPEAEGSELAGLRIGNTRVAADSGAAPARKELWKWLVLATLGVLAFEWWVYHQRVYL